MDYKKTVLARAWMQLTQIYYQRNLLFQEKYEAMIFYGAERLTVNSTMRHFCMCRGIFVRSQSAGMTWLVVSWPRHGGVSVDPDSVTNRHPLTLTHATRCYRLILISMRNAVVLAN